MKLSDLIIIYLACGAPFAVQRFLSRPSGRPVTILSAVTISFLCWPANAIAAMWGWFSIGTSNGRTETPESGKLQLDRVQVELEKIIFSGFEAISIFEFRDIFFRYAGLAAESRQSDAGVLTAEIFEISGSTSSETATRCLQRKNLARTILHFERARTDFVETIASIAAESVDGRRVFDLAIEAAATVDDVTGINELRSKLSYVDVVISKARQLPEIWDAAAPARSAVN